jgi:hypothetical protein
MQVDGLLERPASQDPVSDRIRQNTPPQINNRIDQATMKRVWDYARKSPGQITARMQELDREWDLERVLETGAAGAALTGIILSGVKSRVWLLLPAAVLASLLQHSLTRRSTAVRLVRSLGIRTRREIDAEKYALRMLRGDFEKLQAVSETNHRAIEALRLSRVSP